MLKNGDIDFFKGYFKEFYSFIPNLPYRNMLKLIKI